MKLLLLALTFGCFVQQILSCFLADGECPNENVTFWLYTNKTRNDPKIINPIKLDRSDFLPIQPLKILIHGYTGHRDFAPNSYIRPVLLDNENVYVISIDYGPLVPEPCYLEAVQNLPLVSKCLAQLINNLISSDIISKDLLHVIGFSLGSQVAGQTANYLKHKLKRITGLDPAKPLFVLVDDKLRLDSADAEFVDVIHTNPLARGMLRSVGHVDFYANFRQVVQPGCEQTGDPGSCSHNRAPEFYAESINSTLGFWGRRCESWITHIFGLCPPHSHKALMGYHVSHLQKGSYFLTTSSESPFALGAPGSILTSGSSQLSDLTSIINKIPAISSVGASQLSTLISSKFINYIEGTLEDQYLQQQLKEVQAKQA